MSEWTFKEVIDGRTLWPRRRSHPGDGGLMWHMGASDSLDPERGDEGLLAGDEVQVEEQARRLIGMRRSRGAVSEVILVQIGGER